MLCPCLVRKSFNYHMDVVQSSNSRSQKCLLWETMTISISCLTCLSLKSSILRLSAQSSLSAVSSFYALQKAHALLWRASRSKLNEKPTCSKQGKISVWPWVPVSSSFSRLVVSIRCLLRDTLSLATCGRPSILASSDPYHLAQSLLCQTESTSSEATSNRQQPTNGNWVAVANPRPSSGSKSVALPAKSPSITWPRWRQLGVPSRRAWRGLSISFTPSGAAISKAGPYRWSNGTMCGVISGRWLRQWAPIGTHRRLAWRQLIRRWCSMMEEILVKRLMLLRLIRIRS